jgi:hypothetical protein
VRGQRALQWHLADVSRKMNAGDDVTLGSMKIFRTYDWLVSNNDRDTRERWISCNLKNISSPTKVTVDGIAEDDEDRASSVVASSSIYRGSGFDPRLGNC